MNRGRDQPSLSGMQDLPKGIEPCVSDGILSLAVLALMACGSNQAEPTSSAQPTASAADSDDDENTGAHHTSGSEGEADGTDTGGATGDGSETGGETPRDLLLAVDWRTGLGNSEAAVTDGGKGITRWCEWAQVLSVVEGGPLGFPHTPNVLAISTEGPCGHVEFEGIFPDPDAGQFWGLRWYTMNSPGQEQTFQHPFCLWPVGDIEMVTQQVTTSTLEGPLDGGDWGFAAVMGVHALGEQGGFYAGPSGGVPLVIPAGEWIRYEVIIEWLSPTEFRWHPRVHDADDNILADADSFRWVNFPFTSLSEYQQGGGTSQRSANAVANNPPESIRTPSFGRGQFGNQSPGHFYAAAAAFGLRSGPDDFIGPYVPGEAD
jgi:hypothetical protein